MLLQLRRSGVYCSHRGDRCLLWAYLWRRLKLALFLPLLESFYIIELRLFSSRKLWISGTHRFLFYDTSWWLMLSFLVLILLIRREYYMLLLGLLLSHSSLDFLFDRFQVLSAFFSLLTWLVIDSESLILFEQWLAGIVVTFASLRQLCLLVSDWALPRVVRSSVFNYCWTAAPIIFFHHFKLFYRWMLGLFNSSILICYWRSRGNSDLIEDGWCFDRAWCFKLTVIIFEIGLKADYPLTNLLCLILDFLFIRWSLTLLYHGLKLLERNRFLRSIQKQCIL